MRGEKKPLFKKEAHEEALHFGVISRDDDDDDYHSVSKVTEIYHYENLPMQHTEIFFNSKN